MLFLLGVLVHVGARTFVGVAMNTLCTRQYAGPVFEALRFNHVISSVNLNYVRKVYTAISIATQ